MNRNLPRTIKPIIHNDTIRNPDDVGPKSEIDIHNRVHPITVKEAPDEAERILKGTPPERKDSKLKIVKDDK